MTPSTATSNGCGDAAAARPPLIPYNPALRPRNRGRKTGRRIERSPQRVWATPHEVLIAERAALLSGSDDEFTLIVTIGYTGMRWGEAIGLEREYLCDSLINVEWQLREVGTFHRLPPKDDSYRSTNWEPGVPVDLPPFLADLLSQQISARPPRPCACAGRHGGSGRYVFLGPDGGHHRRGRYAQRLFRPACDGRYGAPEGMPAKIVIVDASAWPGRPVAAWPSAPSPADTGPTAGFTPPHGRGIRRIAEDVPVACWLPVKQGPTPHGRRHSHKTWMEEDGISGILQERRLGHEVLGMRGLCTHISQTMRTELTAALQRRWEDSLRARSAIDPHSPVPLLDELLAPTGPHPQVSRDREPAAS